MVIFFSFCGIAVLSSYIAEKTNKKIWILFTVFFLSFLVGFRAETIGTDTHVYYSEFRRLLGQVSELPFKNEPSFSLIAILFVKIFKNVESIFIFYGFFTNALIISRLWAFRNKGSFALMVLFYTCVYYPQNMNIMRQYASLAICFYATKFLDKKRYPLYVFLILIATTFHLSSIVALFALVIHYWINNNSTKRRGTVIIISIFLLPIIIFIARKIFVENYSGHFETEKVRVGLIFLASILCLICYVFMLLINKDKKIVFSGFDEEHVFIYAMYTIGLALNIVGCFYDQMGRIALSYKLFELPFVAIVSKNNKFSIFFKILYIFMALYFLIVRVAINGECQIVPYHFFFM